MKNFISVFILLLSSVSTLLAADLNRMIVFGDSFADNGQFESFVGDPSNTTHSKIMVEYLAEKINIQDVKNYASGTAALNSSVDHSISKQILDFIDQGNQFNETDLIIIWAGIYDIHQGNPFTQAENLYECVKFVAAHGGKNILLPLLPPLNHIQAVGEMKKNFDHWYATQDFTAFVNKYIPEYTKLKHLIVLKDFLKQIKNNQCWILDFGMSMSYGNDLERLKYLKHTLSKASNDCAYFYNVYLTDFTHKEIEKQYGVKFAFVDVYHLLEPKKTLPSTYTDGFHFSPEIHQLIADNAAEAVKVTFK